MIPRVRCSSLPRILSCTASAENPDIDIDTSGGVASVGTAAHEFYADMVLKGLDSPEYLFEIASKYGVDEDELSMLSWAGIREWKKIRDRIKVTGVEMEMEQYVDIDGVSSFLLSGHPDVIGELKDDPSVGVVVDWKAGYKENGYIEQCKGYGLLDALIRIVEQEDPKEKYLLLVVWTRLGMTETFEVSRDEIMSFSDDICKVFTNTEKRYTPCDSNCMYCPKKRECPARRELMNSTANDIISMSNNDETGGALTVEKLVSLYPQSRILKRAIDAYEKELKAAVEDAGGSIESGDSVACFKESERKSITFNPEIISAYVEDMADIKSTVSKKDLEKNIVSFAPKRQGGKLIKECMAKLDDAGCVSRSTFKKLEFKKKELS